MSKNVIFLSQFLLGRLIPNHLLKDAKLSTPKDFKTELVQLKHLQQGSTWTVYDNIRAADFLLDGEYCIAITGDFSKSYDDLLAHSQGTVAPLTVSGSIYLYIANALQLDVVNISDDEIENQITAPSLEPEGVDLETVISFVEPISVFKVSGNSVFAPSTSAKYVANYICTFLPKFHSSALSTRSMEIIREIFLADKDKLIEVNIFSALSSSLPKLAFLEIYRTLEFIYVFPRAQRLLNKLTLTNQTISMNVIDFARHCYKELGWKRAERDSINRLFSEYSSIDLYSFQDVCANCSPFQSLIPISNMPDKQNDFISGVAEKYYLLRNQVVHQLWPDEEINATSKDWSKLIEFTLGCILYYYKTHFPRN
jgi:hypothetical protein